MCVGENTSQAASVEFLRTAQKLCAQQPASLLSENSEGIFDRVSALRHRPGGVSLWQNLVLPVKNVLYFFYHRLTRANTPASATLRRFLPFSPWRAPARLRLKSQKSLGNPSLAGAKQFCRAEMCPGKERPAGNTCRISKGLDAVWAHFCPSKPCLPLSTDGII